MIVGFWRLEIIKSRNWRVLGGILVRIRVLLSGFRRRKAKSGARSTSKDEFGKQIVGIWRRGWWGEVRVDACCCSHGGIRYGTPETRTITSLPSRASPWVINPFYHFSAFYLFIIIILNDSYHSFILLYSLYLGCTLFDNNK